MIPSMASQVTDRGQTALHQDRGVTRMTTGRFVEGYAIVSEDGMLADASRHMPDALKFVADQQFFEQGLDADDVVVHGRHSQERFARSPLRQRLILTTRVPGVAPHPSNSRARYWNPSGASFDEALADLREPKARIGVIGGTDVFGLFLSMFDIFHLTRAPDVRLHGGRPVFPEVPARRPEEVLAQRGFQPGPVQLLDPAHNLTLVSWQRR
jgi:dihydrofolate reductase